MPHREEWCQDAQRTINVLKQLLGNTAIDIQHIGSTAIASVSAKPIIDIALGVRNLSDILPYIKLLKQRGFVFRGEDIAGQMLFAVGDFENDTRTHHIHTVRWNGAEWNNYINFRDYLNRFPDKAMQYDICKKRLASQFPNDREGYTAGKRELIDRLLKEAHRWRSGL